MALFGGFLEPFKASGWNLLILTACKELALWEAAMIRLGSSYLVYAWGKIILTSHSFMAINYAYSAMLHPLKLLIYP